MERVPNDIQEEHTLSMISMKSLASCSDNARIFAHSFFDDKHDRNDSANSSDLGSSDGRKRNVGDALFENADLPRCQMVASSQNGRDLTSR